MSMSCQLSPSCLAKQPHLEGVQKQAWRLPSLERRLEAAEKVLFPDFELPCILSFNINLKKTFLLICTYDINIYITPRSEASQESPQYELSQQKGCSAFRIYVHAWLIVYSCILFLLNSHEGCVKNWCLSSLNVFNTFPWFLSSFFKNIANIFENVESVTNIN